MTPEGEEELPSAAGSADDNAAALPDATHATDSTAPRGYAAPDRARAEVDATRPVFYFSVLLTAALVAAAHQVFGRLLLLYLDPGSGPSLALAEALGVAAMLAGAMAVRRDAALRNRFPALLVALGLVTGAAAPALFFAFARPRLFDSVVLALPVVAGLLVGAAARAGWLLLARPVRQLGALSRLVNPFRLLAIGLALGVAAGSATLIGLPRAGAAIALVLAVLGGWWTALSFFLERRPLARPRLVQGAAGLMFVAGLGLFAIWQRVVPLADHHHYVNQIVYARHTDRQTFVVTSGQENFELFVDRHLKVSSLDAPRYYEALVHPVLGAVAHPRRVLVLGSADGMAAREILRHPEVQSITEVVVDATIARLARQQRWLGERSHDAMLSPKLHVIQKEPIAWLRDTGAPFDAVIVDLPDPYNYVDSKNYTHYFYRQLARHLAPGAVAVVQATSAFSSPRTFDSIVRTIQSAGLQTRLYHAAVPTFGDWGFVLCATHAVPLPTRVPPGLSYLTPKTLADLFIMPRDLRVSVASPTNTLQEQPIVDIFAKERKKLGD